MAHSIIVKDLSKQYRIGQLHRQTMFREALVNLVRNPFRKRQTKNETIWALKDVSFEVEEGEVVGIIGRNGAGKSTLLKVLSKITHPTSGEMNVRGRVASLLEVGTGFHSELTGRENIYLNGSILGMTKKEIDAKFDDIVAFSGVEKFIDTPIKRYSSGMGLRLGFAVAAHLNPDVLLVDEVLAVGDAGFQKKCLGRMEKLRGEGRTVLFVSHNMSAIENLCPRTIWIHNGKIQQDGDTRDVIHAYLSSFVTQKAGFDLRDAERYRGSGEIRYVRVELLDSQKQPVDVIRSGDSLVIRLHYHAKEVIYHPHFILGISTELGTLITNIATFLMGYQPPVLSPGPGHIDLEIDFLNLMPGCYYVSLSIWDQISGRYYDGLKNCMALDVEASDFYQSGQGIDARYGIIFLPGKWSLGG